MANSEAGNDNAKAVEWISGDWYWCRYHRGLGKVIVEWVDGGVNFRCAKCGSLRRVTGTMAHPDTAEQAAFMLHGDFGEAASLHLARQAWPELFSST